MVAMYSAELLDHFQHPRNAGALEQPDASVEVSNPACGDVLRLSVKVKEGRVTEIRFLAKGCVPAIACGSALTDLVRGKSVTDASRLQQEDVVKAVGGLPEASGHAGYLAIDALSAVLQQVKA